MSSNRKPHPLNVAGPFYVEDGCCTACGVPQLFARELFDEDEESHCFVRRQPETKRELDSMIRVVASQELQCIRYRGVDDAILRRLTEAGEDGQCDAPTPHGLRALRRDHVSFVPADLGATSSGRELLERLTRYLSAQPQHYRFSAITVDEGEARASVSISWFKDDFHRVEAIVSASDARWLVRHYGPPRFSDSLHDWLSSENAIVDVRWQTRAEWEASACWKETPW
jgi:hypothetical protein